MPPKFSLQAILDYHHKRVEVLEVDLSTLLKAYQQALEVLNELQRNETQLLHDLFELQNGEMDLQKIARTRLAAKAVQAKITAQQNEIQSIEEAIQAKKAEIVQAKQDEAVYEKLRDKELERYQEKVKEQEKRTQDDIYTSRTHLQMTNNN